MNKAYILILIALVNTVLSSFCMEQQERNRLVLVGALGLAASYGAYRSFVTWYWPTEEHDFAADLHRTHAQFEQRLEEARKTASDKIDQVESDAISNYTSMTANLAQLVEIVQNQNQKISSLEKHITQLNKKYAIDQTEDSSQQQQSSFVVPR